MRIVLDVKKRVFSIKDFISFDELLCLKSKKATFDFIKKKNSILSKEFNYMRIGILK